MHWVKKALIWMVVVLVVLTIEKKTGLFSWILTAGHRFNNPLIS